MAIVTPIPIPPGPSVPNSNDPETTFDEQFEASLTWQRDELAPKANALAEAAFDNATDAQISKESAFDSATRAETARDAALGGANFKGAWSSLTGALNKPASVSHNGEVWLLLNNLADVTVATPGLSSNWQVFNVAVPIYNVTDPTIYPVRNTHVNIVRAGAVQVFLPLGPSTGDYVVVTVSNGRYDNQIMRNSATIEAFSEDVTLDEGNTTYTLCYLSDGATTSWRFI